MLIVLSSVAWAGVANINGVTASKNKGQKITPPPQGFGVKLFLLSHIVYSSTICYLCHHG